MRPIGILALVWLAGPALAVGAEEGAGAPPAAERETASPAAGGEAAPAEKAEVLTATKSRMDVTPLFTQDRDNYFISGGYNPWNPGRPRIRFQISVKHNLSPQRRPWALFFGYTQKSIWDLWNFKGSSPFEDSNYNPSLFVAWRRGGFLKALEPQTGFQFLGARAGYEHESNGQAGAISRGWDRLSASGRLGYYYPTVGKGPQESGAEVRFLHAIVEAKGWAAHVDKRDASGGGNPDLLEYYGYGQLSLELGYDVPVGSASTAQQHYTRKCAVGILGRLGTNREKYYLEAWARYRPRGFGWLGLSIFVQGVVGYGETLLRYNVWQAPTLRIGVALDDVLTTETLATGG